MSTRSGLKVLAFQWPRELFSGLALAFLALGAVWISGGRTHMGEWACWSALICSILSESYARD